MEKRDGKINLKKGNKVLLLLGMVMLLLTACGSGASNAKLSAPAEIAEEAGYNYETAADATASTADAGGGILVNNGASSVEGTGLDQTVVSDRKLIRTVDLSVETENYDELMAGLEEQVSGLGGYIEYREAYYGSQYSSQNRRVNLQIRIPWNRLDEFTARVKEAGNVTRENESVEDVTLTYVDMESHKRMLITEQERLMELLERAETIEDIIALESRLSEVRYQIESMEAQLRTYDNLVDYSTINLYIEEVERYTPQPEKGTWERIRSGFSENVYKVGKGLKNFFVEFIISIPVLAVWVVVILIIILAVRLFSKWRRNNSVRDGAAGKTGKFNLPLIHRAGNKEEKDDKKP